MAEGTKRMVFEVNDGALTVDESDKEQGGVLLSVGLRGISFGVHLSREDAAKLAGELADRSGTFQHGPDRLCGKTFDTDDGDTAMCDRRAGHAADCYGPIIDAES